MAAAAWLLGLENNLADVFSPKSDDGFLREARLALPKRIRKRDGKLSDRDLDF